MREKGWRVSASELGETGRDPLVHFAERSGGRKQTFCPRSGRKMLGVAAPISEHHWCRWRESNPHGLAPT